MDFATDLTVVLDEPAKVGVRGGGGNAEEEVGVSTAGLAEAVDVDKAATLVRRVDDDDASVDLLPALIVSLAKEERVDEAIGMRYTKGRCGELGRSWHSLIHSSEKDARPRPQPKKLTLFAQLSL